jgi:peptidoglycan/LPS O-acetylase OafA/YrhL
MNLAPTRLPALSGLRGFAAAWVVGFHAWALGIGPEPWPTAPWNLVLRSGWLGVDVFFALSGFLLMRGLLAADGAGGMLAWGRFYALRVARLLPAYYAQLLVLALLGALGLAGVLGWRPTPLQALAHGLLWLNAWPWVPVHLGPWWSLVVEAGFYLSLPLLLPMMRGRLGALLALLAAAALALAWRAGVAAVDPGIEQRLAWGEQVPGRWVQFVGGAWLASRAFHAGHDATMGRPAHCRRIDPMVLGIGSLALLAALPSLMPGPLFQGGVDARPWTWAWPIITLGPVLGLLHSLVVAPRGSWVQVFASTPLRALGTVSFSLYLWHYPVQWGLRVALGGYVPPEWGVGAFFLVTFALALPLAVGAWWLVERPALAWARRRARLPAP